MRKRSVCPRILVPEFYPLNLVDPLGLDPVLSCSSSQEGKTDTNHNTCQCDGSGLCFWVPPNNSSVTVNAGPPPLIPPISGPLWPVASPIGNVPGTSLGSGPGGAPQASTCGPKTGPSILGANATTSAPTVAAGAAIGGLLGGEPGAAIGGLIGSFFGVGLSGSYVRSTKSLYVGPTVVFTPVPGGGTGVSFNALYVPSSQNPNSIASGLSFSATLQPLALFGATVVKTPGAGPAVVGPSIGTRVPVSFGASYSFAVRKGCS